MFTLVFQRPINTPSTESSVKSSVKSSEKTREKTREKIINFIIANNEITTSELATETGISEKGIEYHLANLKKEKIIKRLGPDKGGHWEVIK